MDLARELKEQTTPGADEGALKEMLDGMENVWLEEETKIILKNLNE